MYREEERETLPLCREEKIGVIPYRPLTGERLTHDWSVSTPRADTDQIIRQKYDATVELDKPIVARLTEVAAKRGVPRVHIALAWLFQKEPVTAPILGATKSSHVEEAGTGLQIKLAAQEIAFMEEPYLPHKIVGHQ